MTARKAAVCLAGELSADDRTQLVARWRGGWSVERLRLAYRVSVDEVMEVLRPAIRLRETNPEAFDALADDAVERRPSAPDEPHFARHLDHVEAALLGGGFPAYAMDEAGAIAWTPGPQGRRIVRLVWPPGGGPRAAPEPRAPLPLPEAPAGAAPEATVLRDLEAQVLDLLVAAGRQGLAFRALRLAIHAASARSVRRTVTSLMQRGLAVNMGAGSDRAIYCATAKAGALAG